MRSSSRTCTRVMRTSSASMYRRELCNRELVGLVTISHRQLVRRDGIRVFISFVGRMLDRVCLTSRVSLASVVNTPDLALVTAAVDVSSRRGGSKLRIQKQAAECVTVG